MEMTSFAPEDLFWGNHRNMDPQKLDFFSITPLELRSLQRNKDIITHMDFLPEQLFSVIKPTEVLRKGKKTQSFGDITCSKYYRTHAMSHLASFAYSDNQKQQQQQHQQQQRKRKKMAIKVPGTA